MSETDYQAACRLLLESMHVDGCSAEDLHHVEGELNRLFADLGTEHRSSVADQVAALPVESASAQTVDQAVEALEGLLRVVQAECEARQLVASACLRLAHIFEDADALGQEASAGVLAQALWTQEGAAQGVDFEALDDLLKPPAPEFARGPSMQ